VHQGNGPPEDEVVSATFNDGGSLFCNWLGRLKDHFSQPCRGIDNLLIADDIFCTVDHRWGIDDIAAITTDVETGSWAVDSVGNTNEAVNMVHPARWRLLGFGQWKLAMIRLKLLESGISVFAVLAVNIKDEQPFGWNADIGVREFRPPAVNSIHIGGGFFVPGFGDWGLPVRDKRENWDTL